MPGPPPSTSAADISVDLKAGQIVTVDWCIDPDHPALNPQPPEPNKLRPAVVVQDTDLFHPSYPTVLVVPMTRETLENQRHPRENGAVMAGQYWIDGR